MSRDSYDAFSDAYARTFGGGGGGAYDETAAVLLEYIERLRADARFAVLLKRLRADERVASTVCDAEQPFLDRRLRATDATRLHTRLRLYPFDSSQRLVDVNSVDSTAETVARWALWNERVAELGGDDDTAVDSPVIDDDDTSLFSTLRSRIVCRYDETECLVLVCTRVFATELVRRERGNFDELRRAADERLAAARVSLVAMRRRVDELRAAMRRETAAIGVTRDTISMTQRAVSALRVRTALERERVEQAVQTGVTAIVRQLERLVAENAARRTVELQRLRERSHELTVERETIARNVCARLRPVVLDARCDASWLLSRAEYVEQLAQRCETGGALLLVSATPAEIMSVVDECDVLRGLRNHAFISASADLRAERDRAEVLRRVRDKRANDLRAYATSVYRYCRWRECVVSMLRGDSTLPDALTIQTHRRDSPVRRSERLSDRHLPDDETSERLLRSVLAVQRRVAYWRDRPHYRRNECATVFSLLNALLALPATVRPNRRWLLCHAGFQNDSFDELDGYVARCRQQGDAVRGAIDLLSSAFDLEDSLNDDSSGESVVAVAPSSIGSATSSATVPGISPIAVSVATGRKLRDLTIAWPPNERDVPVTETHGLRFAVLCSVSPMPATAPPLGAFARDRATLYRDKPPQIRRYYERMSSSTRPEYHSLPRSQAIRFECGSSTTMHVPLDAMRRERVERRE